MALPPIQAVERLNKEDEEAVRKYNFAVGVNYFLMTLIALRLLIDIGQHWDDHYTSTTTLFEILVLMLLGVQTMNMRAAAAVMSSMTTNLGLIREAIERAYPKPEDN